MIALTLLFLFSFTSDAEFASVRVSRPKTRDASKWELEPIPF